MKYAGAVILVIVIALGATWLLQGNNFFLYKFFAPKYEQVRRQVFEQTKSYNQGMVQELENMEFKYAETKDAEAKAALASVILHRAADCPEESMPPDLRSFVHKLRAERSAAKY
jgi:hypothetical protein